MRRSFCLFIFSFFCVLAAQAALSPAAEQRIIERVNKLTAPHGKKVGVAILDLKTKWQYDVNGTTEYPTASVGKVAVMAAAYHLADLKQLDLDQKVVYRPSDKLGGAGVLQWMKPGKVFTLRHLILYMIEVSDNTATKMVVDNIGLPKINSYLHSINLEQTRIVDPTMLNEAPSPAINRSTPWDMAHLLYRINNKARFFSDASAKEMLYHLKRQKYHWGIWRGVAPGTVVADKTGDVDKVLNDVGIVYAKNGTYILSVFTYGFVKTREARILINEISKAVFEEYTGTKLSPPKKVVKRKYHRRSIRRHRK
jgi:beta-lactamase class A